MNNKFDIKFLVAISLIILSVGSRLLFDLPPNFSPIMAVALFSGAFFSNRKLAILIPVSALFISDLFIGLHSTMIAVYASFLIITFIGMKMQKISVKNVFANSIFSAVIFFAITNFAVWLAGWYSHSFAGLTLCYEMAIPFFRNTLLSSLAYSAVLFGGCYLAERFALKPAKIS